MASMGKPFRLVNPGRKRKKNNPKRLSLKQKLFFGSKKQRAAAKASLRSNRKKKRNAGMKSVRKTKKFFPLHYKHVVRKKVKARRRKNVGSILTVFNPGVKRRKKSNMVHKVRRSKVRKNVKYAGKLGLYNRKRAYRYTSNPRRSRKRNPVIHYRRKHYTRKHNRHYSRRNPGFLSETAGKVVGVIGGAMVTKFVTETAGGMLPLVSSGIPLYITGAVIAFLQGKLVGKFMKSSSLGADVAVGGYTYVALKVLSDVLPNIPLPFGMSGMGLLTTSNNWGPPWQNVGGSMTRFVRPGGFAPGLPPTPVATTGVHGLGRVRRGGRLS